MEKKKKKENKKRDFESAINELEEIVNIMERGDLPLEKMMDYFEKGKKLADFCKKQLTEYEKKVEILVKEEKNPKDIGSNKAEEDIKEKWIEFDSDNLL